MCELDYLFEPSGGDERYWVMLLVATLLNSFGDAAYFGTIGIEGSWSEPDSFLGFFSFGVFSSSCTRRCACEPYYLF